MFATQANPEISKTVTEKGPLNGCVFTASSCTTAYSLFMLWLYLVASKNNTVITCMRNFQLARQRTEWAKKRGHKPMTNLNQFKTFSLEDSLVNLQINGY